MNNNIIPNSFVAISDFHSNKYPYEKIVKYYLNEYDKIYILGDATDRGPDGKGGGGIELLLAIKSLSQKYPGRVIYIPGNHDDFIYKAVAKRDYSAEMNIKRNGGKQTLDDIKRLRKTDPKALEELIDWLGNLPIQRVHQYNGKKYVLAHALFNQKLYDSNKNFSLKDLNRNPNENLDKILWFRKNKGDLYNPEELPSADSIMIIGHTPERARQGQNLDLRRKDGRYVKVHCVDGGIAYDGEMLKYDGGQNPIATLPNSHKDTSPKATTKVNTAQNILDFDEEEKERLEDILKEIIIKVVYETKNLSLAHRKLCMYIATGDINYLPIKDVYLLERAQQELSSTKLHTIIISYIYNRDNKVCTPYNFDDSCVDYINEACFDYIISSLLERHEGSKEQAAKQVYAYITKGDECYITASCGNARRIARIIGIRSIKDVIIKNHQSSVSGYIKSKFGNNYSI